MKCLLLLYFGFLVFLIDKLSKKVEWNKFEWNKVERQFGWTVEV